MSYSADSGLFWLVEVMSGAASASCSTALANNDGKDNGAFMICRQEGLDMPVPCDMSLSTQYMLDDTTSFQSVDAYCNALATESQLQSDRRESVKQTCEFYRLAPVLISTGATITTTINCLTVSPITGSTITATTTTFTPLVVGHLLV
jgi:hypothetical protein